MANYSTPGEGAQVEYYKIANNRIKDCPYDSFKRYWLRSPQAYNNSNKLYFYGRNGSIATAAGTNIMGVAPFGVI